MVTENCGAKMSNIDEIKSDVNYILVPIAINLKLKVAKVNGLTLIFIQKLRENKAKN